MARYLIVRAAGFIGSNFVDHVLKQDDTDLAVALDILSCAGRTENLDLARQNNRFHFIQEDINEQNRVSEFLTRFEIDTIVHFAAESYHQHSTCAHSPTPRMPITLAR